MAGFDHFNFLAPIYEKAIRQKNPENIIRLAGLPTTGMLLDAGGGTGRIAQMLRGYATRIIIVDISLGMLHQAATKDGLEIVCSRTEQLPFEEDTFDRIIMVDALHHVFDARRTIHDLWRVLKPGGKILIEEPDIRTPQVMLIAIIEKLAFMRSKFIPPLKIASFLEDAQRKQIGILGKCANIERLSYTAWVSIEK